MGWGVWGGNRGLTEVMDLPLSTWHPDKSYNIDLTYFYSDNFSSPKSGGLFHGKCVRNTS
jgi:hypothetical protein